MRSDSDTDRQSKDEKPVVKRLSENVDLEFAYLPMLACCFVSGLTDGTIYNGECASQSLVRFAFKAHNLEAYGTFVSMQTGE
jgi:hypothetical protein